METKTIPFDLETAKKIQAGEIAGRITTNDGRDVRIICTDKASTDEDNRTQIVCLIRFGARELASIHNPKNGECWDVEEERPQNLVLEVPDIKTPFKVGDKVRIRPDSMHGSFVREYDGCIGKIVGTHHEFFVVMVTGAFQAQFTADELELVEEAGMHEFKPFDKVLVRNKDHEAWSARLYDVWFAELGLHGTQDNKEWQQCIPYDGNEHLVGTTDKPKDD